jgi:hypothetical protein
MEPENVEAEDSLLENDRMKKIVKRMRERDTSVTSYDDCVSLENYAIKKRKELFGDITVKLNEDVLKAVIGIALSSVDKPRSCYLSVLLVCKRWKGICEELAEKAVRLAIETEEGRFEATHAILSYMAYYNMIGAFWISFQYTHSQEYDALPYEFTIRRRIRQKDKKEEDDDYIAETGNSSDDEKRETGCECGRTLKPGSLYPKISANHEFKSP